MGKELLTGKVTEQHIENIKNGTLIMARESEIPLNECPQARKPYPSEQVQEGRPPRRVPEGAPDDDWYDDTFWLTPEEMEGEIGNNTLPTQNDVNADKQDGRRISPRRKKVKFPCSVFGDKALYIVYIGKYIIEVLFFFSPRFTFFFSPFFFFFFPKKLKKKKKKKKKKK